MRNQSITIILSSCWRHHRMCQTLYCHCTVLPTGGWKQYNILANSCSHRDRPTDYCYSQHHHHNNAVHRSGTTHTSHPAYEAERHCMYNHCSSRGAQ